MKTAVVIIGSALLCTACASGGNQRNLQASGWSVPVAAETTQAGYRIGPLDLLNITVYQVEDLTFERIQVDAAGNLQLPLIGAVRAAGQTTDEFAAALADRLDDDYLQNPQVSVVVAEAASQKVTVDGAVVEPGVFQMKGRTSLLQAVAMAKGPTRVADLSRVAVFRQVEDRRMVGVFDLRAIRRGEAEDPLIQGDDVIVVDSSATASVWRDIISAAPVLGVFRWF